MSLKRPGAVSRLISFWTAKVPPSNVNGFVGLHSADSASERSIAFQESLEPGILDNI